MSYHQLKPQVHKLRHSARCEQAFPARRRLDDILEARSHGNERLQVLEGQ